MIEGTYLSSPDVLGQPATWHSNLEKSSTCREKKKKGFRTGSLHSLSLHQTQEHCNLFTFCEHAMLEIKDMEEDLYLYLFEN